MKKKTITLIDTLHSGLTYADYMDHCEANEITPSDEGGADFYEWETEMVRLYVEDFFEELRHCGYTDPVIITGTLGLWNGSKEIYPMFIESTDYNIRDGKGRYDKPAILNAINKCIHGMDDFSVKLIEGELVVMGYHHDGTNVFTIHKMTKRGIDLAKRLLAANGHIDPKGYWFAKFKSPDLF